MVPPEAWEMVTSLRGGKMSVGEGVMARRQELQPMDIVLKEQGPDSPITQLPKWQRETF